MNALIGQNDISCIGNWLLFCFKFNLQSDRRHFNCNMIYIKHDLYCRQFVRHKSKQFVSFVW